MRVPPSAADLDTLLRSAIARRGEPAHQRDALRLFHGEADGLDGVFIDRYGPGATLIVNEGSPAFALPARDLAAALLRAAAPLGVTSVYHKPFARDRSGLGGKGDAVLTDPAPLAGPALPEAILVREGPARFEVRLYDGFSTGLFLDQSASRGALAALVARLASQRHGDASQEPPRVLNTFAYTCSFSVACALAGAVTTSVDVSTRYLEWGKRNMAHSGVDAAAHRFYRRGTLEFLEQSVGKGSRWDVVILDPPTFSAGSKATGTPAWSAQRDYARLVALAAQVTAPGGLIYASTNCRALCRAGALEQQVQQGLGRRAAFEPAPAPPPDFPGSADRARWVLVRV